MKKDGKGYGRDMALYMLIKLFALIFILLTQFNRNSPGKLVSVG